MVNNSNLEFNEESKNEQVGLSRTISLNLLIIMFIIMCYFYIAEFFGSISTIFIKNNRLVINLIIPLLLYSFFSTLAGKFHGFVAGFIGEFLYQIAYYDSIYIHWCFIIAIFGFLCGLYKYRPLMYQEKKNFIFAFSGLLVSSLITTVIIIIFYISFGTSQANSIAIGFKFFILTLLTTVFIVPILIFVYDIALAAKERHLYYIWLTHHPIYMSDHTFYLKFGRTYIYFCSRCSGVIIGGLIASFITHLIEKIYNTVITPEFAVLLCIILPIPGIVDWGTQRLRLRKSTTESRLFTGLVIGSALHLLSFTKEYYFLMIFLVIFYFSIIGILIFIGHRRDYGQEYLD
ncbi:MAG: DUF2085 domain-containing protein [Promethearchaeota archaeon]